MGDETIRVVLLEDNPGDALLVQKFLEKASDGQFDVTHVGRLEDVILKIQETEFDVALLDLAVPDAQGLDIVKKVRGVAPDVAIVVLTGRSDAALATESLREGAQDYLNKNADQ